MRSTCSLVEIHNTCLQLYFIRVKEHMLNVDKKEKTIGTHFTKPYHSKSYFRAQIIERVTPRTPNYLLERVDYWIRTLDTKQPPRHKHKRLDIQTTVPVLPLLYTSYHLISIPPFWPLNLCSSN